MPALLKWIEIQGFRAFGSTAIRLDFDGPLVIIGGPNSQGKTSVVEAIEFLLTGRTARREILASAKAQFADCLRNVHLPAECSTLVRGGLQLDDGRTIVAERTLTEDPHPPQRLPQRARGLRGPPLRRHPGAPPAPAVGQFLKRPRSVASSDRRVQPRPFDRRAGVSLPANMVEDAGERREPKEWTVAAEPSLTLEPVRRSIQSPPAQRRHRAQPRQPHRSVDPRLHSPRFPRWS